jgi:hypothetical protein
MMILLDKQAILSAYRAGIIVSLIAEKNGVSNKTIYNRLNSWGINRHKVQFNEAFFKTIQDESQGYWLGFLMSDGCVSRTHGDKIVLALANKDRNQLEKWHAAIRSNARIHKRGCGACVSQHLSTRMCNDLESLGCVPRKSLVLQFPRLPKHLVRHFIRGYFDGDGSVSVTKRNQLKVTFLGTYKFLRRLSQILQIKNKLRKIGSIHRFEVHGNKKAGRVLAWMYEDATVWLERKREVYYSNL